MQRLIHVQFVYGGHHVLLSFWWPRGLIINIAFIAFTNFRIEWSIQWLFGHRFFVHEFFGLEVYAKILLSWPNLTCLFHHEALPRGFSTDGRNNPANDIFHFLQVPYIKPMHPEESNLRPQSRLQRWKRRRRLRLLEVEVKINATLDLRG